MKKIYPIIGMSPGNSYFKDVIVKELLAKVISKYGRTAVLVADIPAISTYVALGYQKNRARRDKALPQGNSLRNKVRKSMDELGYSDQQVKIIDWESESENNQTYRDKYAQVLALYESNEAFRGAAQEATKKVLDYSDKHVSDIDSAIKIAVHYLLSEFAFMEFAPEFLAAEKVIYVYHKTWPVYEAYRTGEFDGKSRDYLESEIVTTDKVHLGSGII